MKDLKKALIPAPKLIEQGVNQFKITDIGENFPKIICDLNDDVIKEGISFLCNKLKDKAGLCDLSGTGDYAIEITVDPSAFDGKPDESYSIKTTDIKTLLTAKDAAGVYYACITFANMLFVDGDTVYVPEAYIEDYPDFKLRGAYIETRYNTEFMTKQHWLDLIDYFAALKINDLQIGVYNCWGYQYDGVITECLYFPLKDHPEAKTPKIKKYYSVAEQKMIHEENILPPMYEFDFFGDLIQYAKRKNIKITPMINTLGHNTLFPRVYPETSAIKEDGTPSHTGFCTRNEKTFELLYSILDELIDRYLIPNGIDSIHLGMDEALGNAICHCEKCRDTEHKDRILEYMVKVIKYVKSKGMKNISICHDMLFYTYNILNEDMKNLFIKEGIYDVTVIDWWAYQDPVHLFRDRADEVHNMFRGSIKACTGYYHWTIPTENNECIWACARLAKKLGFDSLQAYSSWELCYDKNYKTLAEACWNTDANDNRTWDQMLTDFDERYAYICYPDNIPAAREAFRAMSDIMKDETRATYINRVVWRLESYFYCYRRSTPDVLRNFPGEAYQYIADHEEEFTAYLRYLKEKSTVAMNFFENSGVSSKLNDTWLLSAKHYYVLSDEYQTLYGLNKTYNDGLSSEYDVIRELERLIPQREALMLLAEKTRIDVNQITYLRGMSWFRQFMLDLLAYFKKEISEGRKPKLDMMDLRYATGKTLEFLQ